uniref:POZ/BTB and AT hook containing zinc finger 1 n=1 Tax=Bos mutus grunniens TaxID=30521 RepID=A0A8B9X4N9_BOSMU
MVRLAWLGAGDRAASPVSWDAGSSAPGNALWHGVLNGSQVWGQLTSPVLLSALRPAMLLRHRDRLRSHLACHEDKVPCQVCGKYLRAAYMADHLKKHSEGPSNFCSICNRGLQAPGAHPEWGSSVPLRQDLWQQRQATPCSALCFSAQTVLWGRWAGRGEAGRRPTCWPPRGGGSR